MVNESSYHCRVCNSKVKISIDFGMMPIANNLLLNNKNSKTDEYKYHMKTAFCDECGCFQVLDVPDKKLMFNENYAYFASQSTFMQNHFSELADYIIDNYIKKEEDYVLDLGSNDGIFLKNFAQKNIKHIGIDASENVVQESKNKGINAICAFFNDQLTKKIRKSMGSAKIIVSTNTMHHIENCHEVLSGMSDLLSDDGIIIIEDPYLPDMLDLASFEQIYAEHNFIWCLNSYKRLFEQHNLYLNKVQHFKLHGGSMRYFFSRDKKQDESVEKYLEIEDQYSVKNSETYLNFKNDSILICENLKRFLESKKSEGASICGYGATAKSATILNFAKIDSSLISCIYDSTPIKINKLTPGSHILIKNPEEFVNDAYDYTVLFAWNHKEEIIKKETKNGSRTMWVEYIPEIKVINENKR